MNPLQRLELLADSSTLLHREVQVVREALADLTTRLDTVQLQWQQLVALRAGELDTAARMDRLERVLSRAHVDGHIRDMVRRSPLIEAPVPHAIIADALPSEIREAAVDAIPERIFFEARRGRHELPAPPVLAPTHSIATWAFLADVAKEVFVPALVDRFEAPLNRLLGTVCPSVRGVTDAGIRLTISRSRIVLRQPGDVGPDPGGPSDWLTVVLHLTRTDVNSALAFLRSTADESVSLPANMAADTERYTWEFHIGPDAETRRMLGGHTDAGQ